MVAIMAAEANAYVHFLTFDYQQQNLKELACARAVAKSLKTTGAHTIIKLNLALGRHSRLSGLLHSKDPGKQHRYGYYVPGRNLIFLAHAAALAEANDIDSIYMGSNIQDAVSPYATGYPDSTSGFLHAAEKALNAGLKYSQHVRIRGPLLRMTKWQAISYGHDRHFDFRRTWSCYKNGPMACGVCPACRGRILNFHWAGLVDPISYELPYQAALSLALNAAACTIHR